jgi:galactofuranose transport system substrate-binding protein
MKKNLPALFNALVVASFVLTACGGTTATSAVTPAIATKIPATSTAPKKVYEYKDLTISMIMTGSESEWRAINIASFRDTAIALGVKLKFYERAAPGNYQQHDLKQAIDDPEVNVIVINPIELAGWEESLQKAKDANKIVIITDHKVDAPEDLYTTFISSDFVEEGRKAGREMCKLLEGSPKKNIWEIAGYVDNRVAVNRGKGFRETATECGIVISNSQAADWFTDKSREITETWLKKGRDVQGIFAQNDDMGLGVIEALKEAGLVPAEDIKIVSIDAKSDAFKAMLNGELNVTVEYNPLFAPQVYEAALVALNGETLPKWIPVQESVFRMNDPNLKEIAAGRKY